MRSLAKPAGVFQEIFNYCVAGVGSNELRARYIEIFDDLKYDSDHYDVLAASGDLWRIPLNAQGNDEIVVGRVTKKELKSLYSSYMVGQDKPARFIYDNLMASAPGERCPYCGVGRVSTLDHYLPKSKFPKFSVHIFNLIPACRDCNLGSKGTDVAGLIGSQPIHPYYDAELFNGSQWLFGQVNATAPVSIKFYANPPSTWSEAARDRAHAHLEAFDLSARFSVEAAEELALIRQLFIDYYDGQPAAVRREFLLQKEGAEGRLHSNSWKRAMYQALSNNQWYYDGGFR